MQLAIPFVLLLFIIALVLRVDIFFTTAWAVLGVYLLTRLWTRRTAQHLAVRRCLADRAFAGDEVQVDLSVANAGILPIPWVEVTEPVPLDLRHEAAPHQVLSLGPREEQHVRYTLRCSRRGHYTLGPVIVETGDVLGIEHRTIRLEEAQSLTVYPQVVPLHRLGLPTRSALVSLPARMALFEDPARTVGVRDYGPGDPLRRVHWTATAGSGRMLVKQFQPSTARETIICLDLDLDGYLFRRHAASELAIVVAASLAHHIAVEEGLAVGLAVDGYDATDRSRRRVTLSPRPGRAQLMSILDVLARVKLSSHGRFVDLLRHVGRDLPWGATVLIVTGNVNEGVTRMVLGLRKSGHAVALILVQRDGEEMSWGEQHMPAGVPVHCVRDYEDLAVLA